MIELDRDSIWLTQPDGESVPCSLEALTFEIAGSGASQLEPDVLRNAAAAVLHYFKDELGRTQVTLGEFAAALARVLEGLGLCVEVTAGGDAETAATAAIRQADLRELAFASGKLGELDFFPRLHSTLRQELAADPERVEFRGLRSAVKQLLGRKHWTNGCRDLEERILKALREWWIQEKGDRRALLLVS
ncbi:MAG: hypothetical protein DVB31_04060 [Verrucomicrobia bacterium]|nr:MAG: hypothetical protein DVB31_04060 [Verrucomicrobiota bacterium]